MAQSTREDAALELAAAISGEAAGAFSTHLRACARLDPSIENAQIATALADLMSERRTFLAKRSIWDEAFVRGRAIAQGAQLDYTPERCAKALAHLRAQPTK